MVAQADPSTGTGHRARVLAPTTSASSYAGTPRALTRLQPAIQQQPDRSILAVAPPCGCAHVRNARRPVGVRDVGEMVGETIAENLLVTLEVPRGQGGEKLTRRKHRSHPAHRMEAGHTFHHRHSLPEASLQLCWPSASPYRRETLSTTMTDKNRNRFRAIPSAAPREGP